MHTWTSGSENYRDDSEWALGTKYGNTEATISASGMHNCLFLIYNAPKLVHDCVAKGSRGKTMGHLLVSKITASTLGGENVLTLRDN